MTTNIIKKNHLEEVRLALAETGEATKPQLAAKTGLSVVTINSLVRTLLETDEIAESQNTVTSGGRPAAVYSLNANHKMALVFATREKKGEDFITATVINLFGEPVEPYQQFTELSIRNLDVSIEYYTKKYPQIKLAAFALPAKLHDGKLIFCDYKQLDQFELQKHVEENFHIPCLVENDIRITILGYYKRTQQVKGTTPHTVAGIYFPQKYSAGVGVLIDGQILSGSNGIAAEIEYLPGFDTLDWTKRTLGQTIDLIKTVCIMYNPDTLILYDAFLTGSIFQDIRNTFSFDSLEYFRPDLVCIPHIEDDYIYGLKAYALENLRNY